MWTCKVSFEVEKAGPPKDGERGKFGMGVGSPAPPATAKLEADRWHIEFALHASVPLVDEFLVGTMRQLMRIHVESREAAVFGKRPAA